MTNVDTAARCDVCGRFTKEEDLVMEEDNHLTVTGYLVQTWTLVCSRHWPYERETMTTPDDKPTPIKKAPKREPRHQVQVPSGLYETLTKVAKARAIGVPFLVEALLEYGLEHLTDPVLFDD